MADLLVQGEGGREVKGLWGERNMRLWGERREGDVV